MSPAASYLAVTKFYVAAMGRNARIQGVPPFALTYFREEIVELVAKVRDAARFDAAIERLESDPEILALLDGEEA